MASYHFINRRHSKTLLNEYIIRGYIDRGKFDNVDLIFWSVRSSSRREGDWVLVVDVSYRYYSQLHVSLY